MEQNPEPRLLHLLREWRRLAEAEGDAIRAGNWALAQDCQREQAQLRSALERLEGELEKGAAGKSEPNGGLRNGIREQFAGLIEVEKQNLAWVELHRERLTERLLTAEKSRVNLRKLRLTYSGTDGAGSFGQSSRSSTYLA